MPTTNTDTETGWTSDLVSREAVNKILYDGYQAHLHHCTNSVNAAQFVHDLQKAVTALPSPDFEQLTRLREVATLCAIPYEALLTDSASRKWIAPKVWTAIEDAVTALRAALAQVKGE